MKFDSMILDNPVFNVKGDSPTMLETVLDLGLACTGTYRIVGWKVDPKKGLLLYKSLPENDSDVHPFITPMTGKELAPTVLAWLESSPEDAMELGEDDEPLEDDDVGMEVMWRVYTEDWGHVNRDWRVCLAVTPSYGYIGK